MHFLLKLFSPPQMWKDIKIDCIEFGWKTKTWPSFPPFWKDQLPNLYTFTHETKPLSQKFLCFWQHVSCRISIKWKLYLSKIDFEWFLDFFNKWSCNGDILNWFVFRSCFDIFNCIYHIHSLEHFTKYDMVTIKPRSSNSCDKKLASICVFPC